MSVSRPLLLGLGGLVLLGLVQWAILPVFDYRDANAERAERARKRHASLRALAADYGAWARVPESAAPKNRSLFSLVNKEAERLSLSRRIEALRPAARDEKNGGERIELRMTGLYLQQAVQWLHALESRPGVRIDSLTLRRTAKNLIDLDMSVALSGGER